MVCSTAIRSVLLLGIGLGTPVESSSPPAIEDAYQAASRAAGRDPDAQVRLALWCEANGRRADAMRHLALAVLVAPDHFAARGLMGQVRRGASWRRPAEVASEPDDAAHAALREEYEGRRSRMEETADAHWKLALWCERSGLTDEATAHFAAVTRLDPKREAAWKRLGYKKHHGRWLTDAQIAAAKAEAEAREALEKTWRPRLEAWAAQLADPGTRGEALAGLAAVEHPLLVPAIWSVLVAGRHADGPVAVQVLGQIDARDASRALATLAAFSNDAEVRRLATETLKRRDPREWADLLIGMIRKPIQYSVQPVNGPGSAGELFVEGKQYNYRRVYAAPPPPSVPLLPGDQLRIGPDGLPLLARSEVLVSPAYSDPDLSRALAGASPERQREFTARLRQEGIDGQAAETLVSAFSTNRQLPSLAFPSAPHSRFGAIPLNSGTTFSLAYSREYQIPIGQMFLEAERATAQVQEHLRRDVLAIELTNAPIRELNGRVVPVLEEATGTRNGDDPDAWRAWWIDQIGMRQVLPRPANGTSTVTDVVSVQPRPVPIGVFELPLVAIRMASCFGAGTPVHTVDGPRPIEEIQVGDLVLSQDEATGSLAYKPVIGLHHNPPSTTFEVRIGGETIVSSDFHRFWVAGRGWVMARELRVGDTIRAVGRTATVEAIEEGQVQLVYNLDVAETRSFFVGELGVLVHDNSLPSTTIEPFDAVPDLAAIAEPEAGEPGE
ncbi:polymorphic toxin-type HINT domain-containing protein [Tautonia sociabilis]|uniref:Hint domain-containing protein n=1 Tax=Tautonia sociabilis TaxID=2080755 RepID=A0A432MHD4_9BACT|nr:polymorphic toxin-type HINT domain-containing protein [Tautonia sociabilis]RUL86710.1 hypothetical protein TsocGM_15480 [Tautonia sociabilis]